MAIIIQDEKLSFSNTFSIIFFLLMLIAAHVFATHSPAIAQSIPAEPSSSIEEMVLNNRSLKKSSPWDPPMNSTGVFLAAA